MSCESSLYLSPGLSNILYFADSAGYTIDQVGATAGDVSMVVNFSWVYVQVIEPVLSRRGQYLQSGLSHAWFPPLTETGKPPYF